MENKSRKTTRKFFVGIIIVLVVIAIGAFLFLRMRFNLGEIDPNIQNETAKEGTGMLDIDAERTLVVYFSETGNTQKLAKEISDQVGGDFKRIETVVPYPSGSELFDYTEAERDNDERPELKELDMNKEDYDTIFVGYPIWWYTLPMPLYTFFDEYDFSGKTIIPFNTHNGSGDGGTYSSIQQFEPEATVLDGIAISQNDIDQDLAGEVEDWLKELFK